MALPGGAEVNTRGGDGALARRRLVGRLREPVAGVTGDRAVGFASGAALVVRRDAWDAAGGFDAGYFMYGEDLDLSLRLRLAGWEIGLARAAAVEHDYEFAKGEQKWFLPRAQPLGDGARRLPAAAAGGAAAGAPARGAGFVAVAVRGGWLGAKLRAQAAVLRGCRSCCAAARPCRRRRR